MDTRRCAKCQQDRPTSDYYRSDVRWLRKVCKPCHREKKREWRNTAPRIPQVCPGCGKTQLLRKPRGNANKHKRCRSCAQRQIEKRGSHSPKWTGTRHFPGVAIYQWKANAARREIPYALSNDDLDAAYERQGGRCALSGFTLTFEENSPYRFSLDRRDSELGYTPDNIQFVCAYVNWMKGDRTEDVFIQFCRAVADHASTPAAV